MSDIKIYVLKPEHQAEYIRRYGDDSVFSWVDPPSPPIPEDWWQEVTGTCPTCALKDSRIALLERVAADFLNAVDAWDDSIFEYDGDGEQYKAMLATRGSLMDALDAPPAPGEGKEGG